MDNGKIAQYRHWGCSYFLINRTTSLDVMWFQEVVVKGKGWGVTLMLSVLNCKVNGMFRKIMDYSWISFKKLKLKHRIWMQVKNCNKLCKGRGYDEDFFEFYNRYVVFSMIFFNLNSLLIQESPLILCMKKKKQFNSKRCWSIAGCFVNVSLGKDYNSLECFMMYFVTILQSKYPV